MSNITKSIPADERKMLKKAFWRSFTLYAAVSPAKQGASGFCYSLMPFINKFYKNDEEGKKAAYFPCLIKGIYFTLNRFKII